MPTVLCISYLFPPRAGVGVQRITKIVRYLPDYGWHPIVLTPKKPAGSFPIDKSYLEEIPDSVEVYEAPSIEPYHIYRMLGGRKPQDTADFRSILKGGQNLGLAGRVYSAFQAAFLIPDPKIGWFGPALRKARKILKARKIDLIFSTSPEATAHVIARAIARETGLPWVMDFRDPWTTSLYAIKRPRWARLKEEALELSCLQNASAITVVQDQYKEEYLKKYPSLLQCSEKIQVFPNGFDPGDFEGVTPRKFDRWTVVYTGSISYPRDPEPFFKGWKLACERSDNFRANAGCLFMGEFDSRFHAMVSEYIMEGLMVESFQPRQAVYSAQSGSHALLLISEGYVTGKAYEYLASGKPVIALTEGPDLIRLMEKSGVGYAVRPDDINGIAMLLLKLFENRGNPIQPDKAYINQFDRRQIVARLSNLFNELIKARQ